jgi:hypothetical protein
MRQWYANNLSKVRADRRAKYAKNRSGIRAQQRKWRARNPEVAKEYCRRHYEKSKHTTRPAYFQRTVAQRLWWRNNWDAKRKGFAPLAMTCEEFAAWYKIETAKGKHCRCCGKIESKLAVDHDHETGKVRDLICKACNMIEGLARDVAHLGAVATYMRHHKAS